MFPTARNSVGRMINIFKKRSSGLEKEKKMRIDGYGSVNSKFRTGSEDITTIKVMDITKKGNVKE